MKKYIIILLLSSSCAYPITDEVSDDDIIKLSVPQNKTIPADGNSIIELTVQIPSNADDTKRTITFNTSEGAFLGSNSKTEQQKADILGKAITQLRSIQSPAIAYISAETNGFKRTDRIEFVRAFPEKIIVETGTVDYKIKDANNPTITTKLLRSIGKTSSNTEVALKAFDGSGVNEIGIFKNITTSNLNGEVTANLVITTTSYRGKCIVRAIVNDSNLKTEVKGESTINVVD